MLANAVKNVLRRVGVEVMSTKTRLETQARFAPQLLKPGQFVDVLDLIINVEFMGSPPFFVQVGANDGLKDDQLSQYIKQDGWSGILIEPQAEAFERLQFNYRDCDNLRFENTAIGAEQGTLKLYRFVVGPDARNQPDVFTTADRSRLVAESGSA